MKESIINIKIKIGEIEFECSGNFEEVNHQRRKFYEKLPVYIKVLKKEELNEKDIDSNIKQLMEVSIKKLNLPEEIVSALERSQIYYLEDLLSRNTGDLEMKLRDKKHVQKIDTILKKFDLYRGMKYSQIDLPESIFAKINLRYDD